MKKNFLSRIKAVIVGTAMMATTFVTPALSSVETVVVAASAVTQVSSLPYTLIADEDGNGNGVDCKAEYVLPKNLQSAKTLTFNFTTNSEEKNASVSIYGFGLSAAPYWADEKIEKENLKISKGSCSVMFDIPSSLQGKISRVGFGVFWPQDNSKWTLTSVEANGTAPITPNIPDVDIPGTKNDKSGTCKFVKNNDNTATISATLSAQYAIDGKTEFDYLLTQGYDEEKNYTTDKRNPTLDADGNELPMWEDGMPINSRKFKFQNFGIDDISNITFQSFEFAVKSEDYDMSTIQYGGGINVNPKSVADTEYVKGKNGYWYNDQGEDDMAEWGSKFEIDDVHGGYEASGCGGYAKLTWDVPKGVQPHVDLTGQTAAVGFQYWWGKDDTKTSTIVGDDGENVEVNYEEVPEIHLVGCTATYTRTMTVPYTKTITKNTNTKLTLGADATNQIKYNITDLNLGERDKISAVKFSFKSASALSQFVGGVGISVDEVKADGAVNVVDGTWYQPGNIAVINTNGTFDVMWILPNNIREAVYHSGEDLSDEEQGKVLIGYWYGDKDGEKVDDITVTSVEYYVFESQEEDLKGEDGLELPKEITLEVGETYDIDVNVPNSTFESDMETAAKVDENGTITAVAKGTATITVTTPEGQTAEITVVVKESSVTTATTTTTTTSKTTVKTTAKTTTAKTTTTQPTTTVDPSKVIDWTLVLYGDVTVDGYVNLADVTWLAKYFLNDETYPLKNATAVENSDVLYDETKDKDDLSRIDKLDLAKLIEYNLGAIDIMDLGPADKSKVDRDPYYSQK